MTDQNGQLSDREIEILRLVATGASNKEIASELVISVNTVKVHLKNIFVKLDVTSRTEATLFAVREGLVEDLIGTDLDQQGRSEGDLISEAEKQSTTQRTLSIRLLFLVLFIVIIVFLGIVLFVNRQQSENPVVDPLLTSEPLRWQSLANLSFPRSSFAYTTYNNHIFAIAGTKDKTISGFSEQYEPDVDSWSRISQKPIPVKDVSAVVLGGQIYVPGGETADGEIISDVEVYNPQNDQWDSVTPLPLSRSAYSLVSFEGKLFLFGGWDGRTYSNTVFEYDPVQDVWNQRDPMPTARGFAGAAVVGEKIYILGGYDGKRALDVNEIYSPGNKTELWSIGPPLPQGRYGMGVASLADTIYLLGGESNQENIPTSFQFKPATDEWIFISNPFAQSWSHMGIASMGTNLYIFGGDLDGVASDQLWYYQAIYTISIPVIQQ